MLPDILAKPVAQVSQEEPWKEVGQVHCSTGYVAGREKTWEVLRGGGEDGERMDSRDTSLMYTNSMKSWRKE